MICNDTIVTSNIGKAEAFNEHFSSVGKKMSKNIKYHPLDFAQYMPQQLNKTLLLRPVTINEIKKIAKCLTNKNSSGIDLISQKILKTVFPVLADIITNLINAAIKDRIYPQCLKRTIITPIFKAGDTNSCTNYRPISLLSSFNKLFEKKIHNDLCDFFENNNLLYSKQFGFRKFHSTIDALTSVYDHIITQRRSNKQIVGIFIDLKKAFDSIDTNILIKKLQYYGINGPYNELLESYLSDRTCQTKVKDAMSEPKIINFGVPQGSIIGPLLFTMYINDIKTLSDDSEVNLFADDTCLFCSANNNQQLEQKCNLALEKCKKWLTSNALTLNVEKTHFVNFSKNADRNNIVLKIGDNILNEEADSKYLGLILQNDLSFDKHVKSIIKKINSKIPLFYQLREIISRDKRIQIFNALVLPNVIYGIELYAKKNSVWLQTLQKAQNRILKILLNLNRLTNTNYLHKEKKILKVTDMHKLRTILIGHKVIHHPSNCNTAQEKIKRNERNGRTLRNNNNLVITTNTFSVQNTVGENVAKLWNSLNMDNKEIKNRETFKCVIKNNFINSYQ